MMRITRRLRALVRSLLRGAEVERELDDELTAYLDHRIAALEATGVARAEARRRVLAEEGGAEAVKERTREARAGSALLDVLQDIRYGGRTMRRRPGYAVVSCLTLAIGIGASVAMFAVMRSVLWRPLPYPAAEQLVTFDSVWRGRPHSGLSHREVSDLAAGTRTLSHLAVVNGVGAHVEIDGEVDYEPAASVSADLLPSLGATPALGRLFDARDDSLSPSGQVRSVIFSDALWRRRLNGDPAAVGRWITVNNTPRQLIGVLPPGFDTFLPASTGVQEGTHVWFPTAVDPTEDVRGSGVIGRLREGATIDDARRELELFGARFVADRPRVYAGSGVAFSVSAMREALTAGVNPGLRMLGLAVGFLLLVSCVNIANLTLARSAGRTRELAVRRALGARPARIARQLLTEGLLLAVIGGAGGLLVARLAIGLIGWLRTADLPRQGHISIDAQTTAFAIAVTAAAGLIFGLLPALRCSAANAQALKAGRADSPAAGARRLQRALVVAEVALSIVPLVAAGLMIRSFVNLQQTPLGFTPDRIVTAWVPLSARTFPKVEDRWRVHAAMRERLAALPGVEAVSGASPPPFHSLKIVERYAAAGDTGPGANATLQSALPGYLGVAGTRLIAGRDFTDDDLTWQRHVVIVDERLARELWPKGAIGQRLWVGINTRAETLEVIGVTEPVRATDLTGQPMPHIFVPYHEFALDMAYAIKTSVAAEALAPALKRIAAEAGTHRAVTDVWPLSRYVDGAMSETRFLMLVLASFAGISLLLAAVGLYGTLAHLTAQRSREFGVRLALGATARQLLSLVAREGLRLTAAGCALGVAGALAAARAMRGLLVGVEPLDPLTLGGVAALVAAVALAATLRPARAAAKVDPVTVLRAD